MLCCAWPSSPMARRAALIREVRADSETKRSPQTSSSSSSFGTTRFPVARRAGGARRTPDAAGAPGPSGPSRVQLLVVEDVGAELEPHGRELRTGPIVHEISTFGPRHPRCTSRMVVSMSTHSPPSTPTSWSSAPVAPAPPPPSCWLGPVTDVVVVDRATFPSPTLSTHALSPAGALVLLARWGLLDTVLDTGGAADPADRRHHATGPRRRPRAGPHPALEVPRPPRAVRCWTRSWRRPRRPAGPRIHTGVTVDDLSRRRQRSGGRRPGPVGR